MVRLPSAKATEKPPSMRVASTASAMRKAAVG